MNPSDVIWNRAATGDSGEGLLEADRALCDLLRAHSSAMSNGLVDAVGSNLDAAEVTAAIAGYRFFGLDAAADVLEEVHTRLAGRDPIDLPDNEGDELETCADRYAEVIPMDSTIVQVFEDKYAQDPTAFAPIA